MLSLTKKISLLTIVGILVGTVMFAQEKKWDKYPYPQWRDSDYKEYIPEKRQDQQDKFLDSKYTHPAKPKHKTEIGIDLGSLHINGDVHPHAKVLGVFPGYGLGLHVRRSIGYLFSLKLSGMGGAAFGQNWEPSFGYDVEDTRNVALSGNETLVGTDGIYSEFNEEFGTPNYSSRVVDEDGETGLGYLFYNYKTKIRDISLSGVVNLNNLKFHTKRNLMNFHAFAGFGGLVYDARMNQLDENGNEYDGANQYPEVLRNRELGTWSSRKDILNGIKDVTDNTYESKAERHQDDIGGYWFGDNYNFQPTVHVGTGVSFKLTDMINLGLDTKITITRDDLLDGQRWQEWGGLSRDFDTYSFTNATLNFNLGGENSVEPLYWMSPLDYTYQELQKFNDLEIPPPYELKDKDGDGVPDEFDDESDTPEGCPVNTRGVSLDSDGDGVVDCEDKQPFTAYDLISDVDKDGVAERPIVEPKCDCPEPIQTTVSACDWFLPMIHFDLDKAGLKSEFYPHLHHVATAMKACPSMEVAVVGHTDTRAGDEYNNKLSCKRAQSAIDYLVQNYGIDRYRLKKSFKGETTNLVAGAKKDGEHYLNRRVEFLTGGAASGYYDLGPCPGEEGYINPNPVSTDSYYGSGSGSSIFIDK